MTLAYTPGNSGVAHPWPQLTTPAITALPFSLQTNGPPESPWQESLPPTPGYPAQIIVSVIVEKVALYAEVHWAFVIAGTLTYCKLSVDDPPNKQK